METNSEEESLISYAHLMLYEYTHFEKIIVNATNLILYKMDSLFGLLELGI
jgi:alpha-N-acetylglucosamine transferase